MPMGPYKDFSACISAQRNKGKSPESAKRICGKIQAMTEGKGKGDKQKHGSSSASSNADVVTVGPTPQMRASMQRALSPDYASGIGSGSYQSNLSDQLTSTTMSSLGLLEEETYDQKVARIMREKGVDKEIAEAVVDKLVAEEAMNLQREEFELKEKLAELEAQEELAKQGQGQGQEQESANNGSTETTGSTATN